MNDVVRVFMPGAFNPFTLSHLEMVRCIIDTFREEGKRLDITIIPCPDKYLMNSKNQKAFIPFWDRINLISGSIYKDLEDNDPMHYDPDRGFECTNSGSTITLKKVDKEKYGPCQIHVSAEEQHSDGLSTYNTIKNIIIENVPVHISKTLVGECYIAIGDDVIDTLTNWKDSYNMLGEFKFIIFQRSIGYVDLSKKIANMKIFRRPYYIIPMPENKNYSSTSVREAWIEYAHTEPYTKTPAWYWNNIAKRVPPLVLKYLDEHKSIFNDPSMEVVDPFKDFIPKKARESIVNWIRDWFKQNGDGCKAVIGMSGGKDSTLVAELCVEALGKRSVLGVIMPSDLKPYYIDKSLRWSKNCKEMLNDDMMTAMVICDRIGIDYVIIPIGQLVNALTSPVYHTVTLRDIDISDQAKVNLPARIRMSILYMIAQSVNGRVANTCNRSEDYVGYSTRWGDSVGDFAPIANYTVTEVLRIARTYQDLKLEWIHRPPSDGLCGKTDEESLGFSYEVLDKYIMTAECDDTAIAEKIDEMHTKNAFKMKMMESAPRYEGE